MCSLPGSAQQAMNALATSSTIYTLTLSKNIGLHPAQARMIVADAEVTLEISGDGEVLEPHDGVLAIGSGGGFAAAASRALLDIDSMDASSIAEKAMRIAADSDIYTNSNFKVEKLKASPVGASQQNQFLPSDPFQLSQ